MEILDRILRLAAETVIPVSKVEPAVQTYRMGRCEKCPRRDETANRCKVCKCFLDVKTWTAENRNLKKMRNEITHCPLGGWGDLEIANIYRELDGLPLLTEPIKILP